MNILITGGTGLIGRALSASLLEDGHRVTILTRAQRSPDRSGVTYVNWDGRTPRGWGHLLAEMDGVVNLAGENIGAGLWSGERKQRIRASRLNAGHALSDALRGIDRRPQVLIQSSAVGYYGVDEERSFDEGFPPGSDFLSGVGVDWEESTREIETLGVRRVIIRTGVVLDPKEGILPRFSLPFRLFVGGPMGSGRQWISWISLRDEVRAIRFLLERETSRGAYNLCTPRPVRNADFGRALGRVMGRPYWLPVPAFALRLVLGEMSILVLEGQQVLPTRLLQEGFEFLDRDLEATLKALL